MWVWFFSYHRCSSLIHIIWIKFSSIWVYYALTWRKSSIDPVKVPLDPLWIKMGPFLLPIWNLCVGNGAEKGPFISSLFQTRCNAWGVKRINDGRKWVHHIFVCCRYVARCRICERASRSSWDMNLMPASLIKFTSNRMQCRRWVHHTSVGHCKNTLKYSPRCRIEDITRGLCGTKILHLWEMLCFECDFCVLSHFCRGNLQ